MITPGEVKTHLRLSDSAFNVESEIIELYIEAATKHCEQYINRPLVIEGDDLSTNEDIKLGCLMLVGHFHENRESVIISDHSIKGAVLPFSSKSLWQPYRCINI